MSAAPVRPVSPRDLPDPAALPATPGASWWNLANALTFGRLLLVPLIAVVLLAHGGHRPSWRIAATVLFAVASLTDRIDGEVARRRGLVTSLGKLADPIADKALTGTVLIGLSVLGAVPVWVTVVVLVREVGVTLLRFLVLRHGAIAVSRGGKVKTALQGLALGCYLLPIGTGFPGTLRAVLLTVAVIVTVVTGADYLARAATLRRGTGTPTASRRRPRR